MKLTVNTTVTSPPTKRQSPPYIPMLNFRGIQHPTALHAINGALANVITRFMSSPVAFHVIVFQ